MTMLDRMRRHKGWLKWSLGLVVLAFIVFYIPSFLDQPAATVGAMPNEVIAEVDGAELTAGEFQRRYNGQIQAYRNAYGAAMSDALLRQLGIEQQILQQMIDEQAALAEARRQGIRVSDEELARQIFSIPGLQENGRFVGEARYEQILRSQVPPLTKRDFEESLRSSMMIDRLRAAVTDWLTVSDATLAEEYRRRNEQVRLELVALTADAFRDQVTVSDADIQAYYDQHQAEYRVAETRRVKLLLLDRDQVHAQTTIPAADVQNYYNSNIALFQTPEQVRARHILLETAGEDEAAVRAEAEDLLRQIREGADFAALAQEHSDDTGSAPNGGDLDYFGRGQMVPEFEEAAFALEPGQVSDIVQSQFGLHIIQVEDKRAAVTQPLDEVRPQIEDQLKWERTDQQITAQATQLATRIDDPSDLDAVAAETGFQISETGYFALGDPIPGLGVAPEVSATAFRLPEGVVSEVVSSPRGPVFFAVTDVRDPYVPPLDEVRGRVQEDLIRERALELSRERAGQIAASLRSAPNFVAAAEAQGFEAVETELVTRETPLPNIGVSAEVDRVAFTLPVGTVSEPITTTDATVIVRVVERDEVTDEELAQARDAFREELLAERRGRFFNAYMTQAKERMNIEIDADVVRRVTNPLGGTI